MTIAFVIVVFVPVVIGGVFMLRRSYADALREPTVDLEGERLASLKRAYASTDMTLDEFEEQVAQVLNGVQPAVHASAGFSVNPYRVIGQHPDIRWQPRRAPLACGTATAYWSSGTAHVDGSTREFLREVERRDQIEDAFEKWERFNPDKKAPF